MKVPLLFEHRVWGSLELRRQGTAVVVELSRPGKVELFAELVVLDTGRGPELTYVIPKRDQGVLHENGTITRTEEQSSSSLLHGRDKEEVSSNVRVCGSGSGEDELHQDSEAPQSTSASNGSREYKGDGNAG